MQGLLILAQGIPASALIELKSPNCFSRFAATDPGRSCSPRQKSACSPQQRLLPRGTELLCHLQVPEQFTQQAFHKETALHYVFFSCHTAESSSKAPALFQQKQHLPAAFHLATAKLIKKDTNDEVTAGWHSGFGEGWSAA